MRILILLLFSFSLAGEMEINGDLKVTGSIDAPGLGGMKPERIYQYKREYNTEFSLTVPEDKIWMFKVISHGSALGVYLDAIYITVYHGEGLLALPGQTLSSYIQ